MTTSTKIGAAVLGFLLLFVVWEYAPPMWGGLLLVALVLTIAFTAIRKVGPVTSSTVQ